MHLHVLAAHCARGLQVFSRPPVIRGRRECRMHAAPAISFANCRKLRTRAYRAAEAIRHSLRNGFTAYIVLSPENGSFASVAGGKPPTDLTPAPRRQDHTPSPYASAPSVYRHFASTASHRTF